jgi:hypothetical protein
LPSLFVVFLLSFAPYFWFTFLLCFFFFSLSSGIIPPTTTVFLQVSSLRDQTSSVFTLSEFGLLDTNGNAIVGLGLPTVRLLDASPSVEPTPLADGLSVISFPFFVLSSVL